MLNDVYEEQLLNRQTPLVMVFAKGVVYLLAAVVFIGGFFFKPLFIIGIAAFFGAFFLTRQFDVEFEYIYVNGELDIDKILGKASRRKVVSVDVHKLESLKPSVLRKPSGNERDHFQGVTYDCTSRTDGAKVYEMLVQTEDGAVRIYFEPKEEILTAIGRIAPGKVTK